MREMYERVYGEKYAEAEGLGYAEIAKLIRADIKNAVKVGALPGGPKNYQVKTRTFAGGGAIDVTVVDLPGLWQDCKGIVPGTEDGFGARACPYHDHEQGHKVLTVEGQEVKKTAAWLLNRYNHDGTEIQVDYFDVNYYGHVTIEADWARDFRLREKARKAEAKKNAAAKKALVDHLVARHGQRVGRLRNFTYDALVAAHEQAHALTPKDHGVEEL